jgi:hypothetical protein
MWAAEAAALELLLCRQQQQLWFCADQIISENQNQLHI